MILPYTGEFDRFTQFQPALMPDNMKKLNEVNSLLEFCPKKIASNSKRSFYMKNCQNWTFLQLFEIVQKNLSLFLFLEMPF